MKANSSKADGGSDRCDMTMEGGKLLHKTLLNIMVARDVSLVEVQEVDGRRRNGKNEHLTGENRENECRS